MNGMKKWKRQANTEIQKRERKTNQKGVNGREGESQGEGEILPACPVVVSLGDVPAWYRGVTVVFSSRKARAKAGFGHIVVLAAVRPQASHAAHRACRPLGNKLLGLLCRAQAVFLASSRPSQTLLWQPRLLGL